MREAFAAVTSRLLCTKQLAAVMKPLLVSEITCVPLLCVASTQSGVRARLLALALARR